MKRFSTLAFRNLKARFVRTILTTAGIILGVGVILAISITNESTIISIRSMFEEAAGKADLMIEPASEREKGFDRSVLEHVRRTEGVLIAAPATYAETVLAGQSAVEGKEVGLMVYGIDPAVDQKVRFYKVVEGDFLPEDGEHHIILVAEFAREHNIKLGESVEILTAEGIESFTVVGLVAKEGPGRLHGGAVAAIPIEVARRVFARGRKIDAIHVVAEEGVDIEDLRRRLEKRLGRAYLVTYPAARGKLISQMLSSYRIGLQFFSVIAIFVGGFLVYNVFSMTVVERTREIGMLRAIGTTRAQILRLVLSEAALFGILGSGFGILFGFALAKVLINMMTSKVGVKVTYFSVPPSGLAICLAVGTAVTVISALVPAIQASQITPIEALRPMGRVKERWFVRKGWLLGFFIMVVSSVLLYIPIKERLKYPISIISGFVLFLGAALFTPITVEFLEGILRKPVRLLYGNEGALGSGNIRRAKGRTALTTAALMVGIAMMIGIGTMSTSIITDIRDWVDGAIGGDLYIRSKDEMNPRLGRKLAAIRGVEGISPTSYFNVELGIEGREAETLAFRAIDPENYERVASFQFAAGQGDEAKLLERLSQGNAVFISTVVSDKYNLKKGNTIRLKTARGERDFLVAGIIVDWLERGYAITGTRDDMYRYFAKRGVDTFVVKLKEEEMISEMKRLIEERFGKGEHIEVKSNEELKSSILAHVEQQFALFNVLVSIGIIIAGLGVVNTLTMNVLERTREIGVLRALGMTGGQVAKMVLAEALSMGAIGGLYGLSFGSFLSRVFLFSTNAITGYQVSYTFPVSSLLTGAVIALFVSQIAALYPVLRATGINIIRAVQYE